jgi:5-methyltetrahydrofolate--homocysteine methyltransferase
MLGQIIANKWLKANGVVGIFPASSEQEDIILYDPQDPSAELERFYFLRNQEVKDAGVPNLCLSDFIAPEDAGFKDYVGLFAATAGIGCDEKAAEFAAQNDDYRSLMIKVLADRLAEAFAEWLHKEVRKNTWGYVPDENLNTDELLKESYRGIRPAIGYPSCPDHQDKVASSIFWILKGKPEWSSPKHWPCTPGHLSQASISYILNPDISRLGASVRTRSGITRGDGGFPFRAPKNSLPHT